MTVGVELLVHATALAHRLESTGADLLGPLMRATRDGLQAEVHIEAEFPGAGQPAHTTVTLRERWVRPFTDQPWELDEYAYELLDRDRSYRRAFHLHDQAWFVAELRTVVHEHCEQPIGNIDCRHYAGVLVTDGFQVIDRLMAIWTDDAPPDCSTLHCLD